MTPARGRGRPRSADPRTRHTVRLTAGEKRMAIALGGSVARGVQVALGAALALRGSGK